MTQGNKFSPRLGLDQVKQQFEEWRKIKKGRERIPEKLWDAAVSLSDEYPISRIARELRLNYSTLKSRIIEKEENTTIEDEFGIIKKVADPAFIELDFNRPAFVSGCVVEMQNSSGAKMRMCFKGKTDFDLLELGKAFWRNGT
jgi:hypothetical protein